MRCRGSAVHSQPPRLSRLQAHVRAESAATRARPPACLRVTRPRPRACRRDGEDGEDGDDDVATPRAARAESEATSRGQRLSDERLAASRANNELIDIPFARSNVVVVVVVGIRCRAPESAGRFLRAVVAVVAAAGAKNKEEDSSQGRGGGGGVHLTTRTHRWRPRKRERKRANGDGGGGEGGGKERRRKRRAECEKERRRRQTDG